MSDRPARPSLPVRTRRAVRDVAEGTVARLRGHDLMLAAAGLTFYAAIAIVPLLLVGWRLAGLVLGDELVRELTLELARFTPESLGFAGGIESLGAIGTRLNAAAVLAALVAGSTYGEGLVRAFDRFSSTDRRAKGLRGRALALVFVAALGVAIVVELALVAAVPAVAPVEDNVVLRFYLAFWAGWIISGLLVALLYRAFGPRRVRGAALAWSAAGTGSFLAGMTLGWVVVLEFGVDVGLAFGGSTLLGTLVLCAVYLFLVQVVLLVGFSAMHALDARGREDAADTGRAVSADRATTTRT